MKFRLISREQARTAIANVMREVWPLLEEGKVFWFSVQEETRTLPQNAKFHAICGDLAKSGLKWMGKKPTTKQWKVLLVSGHAVATGGESEIVPGLEGEFVNIRESTALMSVQRGASLIEYAMAFCAANNVPLSDPDDYRNWGYPQ